MVEKRFEKLGIPDIERFENYLPTAFNSELTLLQKVNKIIFDLMETNKLTNEMIDYLNKFIEKFDEKLYKTVYDVLFKWLDDGVFDVILRDYVLKLGNVDIFREFDLTIMEKMKNEFHERGVSPMWFGAVGDGEFDSTNAFQLAVDFASKLNTQVYLPKGVFIVESLNLPNNTRFNGLGGTIKLKNGVMVDETKNYYFIHNLDNSESTKQHNILLKDLIIDGNRGNNPKSRVGDCVTLVGDRMVIDGCTILNSPDSGIMFSGVTNSRITNCLIKNGSDLGIYVNRGENTDFDSTIISGNIIENFTYGGIGIKRRVTNLSVVNNYITKCGNGITLENASFVDDFSFDILIDSNRIELIGLKSDQVIAAGRGIDLRGGGYSTITNNKITYFKGSGITVNGSSHNLISNNIIVGLKETEYANNLNEYGVLMLLRSVDGVVYRCDYNIISNNIITNIRRQGIYINPNLTIPNATENIVGLNIFGNSLFNFTGIGISLSGYVLDSIIQNNITNVDSYILETTPTCERLIITNNVGKNTGFGNMTFKNMVGLKIGDMILTMTRSKPTNTSGYHVGDIAIEATTAEFLGWKFNGTDWVQI